MAAIAQTRGKHAPECVSACVCAYFRVHNSSFYASFQRERSRLLYRDRSADRAARGRELFRETPICAVSRN